MALVMTLVIFLKHLLALFLATPCLSVDFLVERLEYALYAIFTVMGQVSTTVRYEPAFDHD